MSDTLGAILEEYEKRLRDLRNATLSAPSVNDALFDGFDAWERLLTFKLAPRLAGEGCLIVAVAGGTNTGKSSIFNALIRRALSPVSPHGAYTRRTLVAANAVRHAQCVEAGKLLPDRFAPQPWDESNPALVSTETTPPMTVFVARHDELPDRMVVLDTPDIDSVVTTNWELAKTIREAGDVMVAVITAQKYADKCVVDFFREAFESGRLIVPVMNLLEDTAPARGIARRQISDFFAYILAPYRESEAPAEPYEGPAFVLPRSSSAANALLPCPVALDNPDLTLMSYLTSIDALALKNKILRESLEHFTEQGEGFLARAAIVHGAVQSCIRRIEGLARAAAANYTPKPGREVLTVVYEFIQQHAHWPDRMLGAATAQVLKIPDRFVKSFRRMFSKKAGPLYSEEQFTQERTRKLKEIIHALYGGCIASARELRRQFPYAAVVVEEGLKDLEPTRVAETVAGETLDTASYIGPYKTFAYQELEARWREWRFRWKVRLLYDFGLLGSWAGVLVLLSVKGWAPGLPLSEILASFTVPVAQHTVTHAALYLWGDKLAGLIDRWQSLQRAALERAILTHLTHPALGALREVDAALNEHMNRMKELNKQCQQSSSAKSSRD